MTGGLGEGITAGVGVGCWIGGSVTSRSRSVTNWLAIRNTAVIAAAAPKRRSRPRPFTFSKNLTRRGLSVR